MGRAAAFYGSSIGKKIIVAVTGVSMILFLVAHMIGNLRAFEGAEALNEYAELLRFEPLILWVLRLGLLTFLVLHIVTITSLTRTNLKARPSGYVAVTRQRATLASRAMLYGGIALFLYVVYHLLHLTFREVHTATVPNDHHNVYGNVVLSFQQPAITAIYLVAQVFLFLHLIHGFQSAFRTLGLTDPVRVQLAQRAGIGVALVICLGFVSVPIGVLTGSSDEVVIMKLDARIPSGPIELKWDRHRFEMKLVNPANKRKFSVIVVGTGLAGASAAASLAELGYHVKTFCYQDSPRRAHSIAAQGGINAAKNYQNDGDSIWRLFYDTVKGGDYRAREANVYRLAQVSVNIIDQAVAQGVPFAREYGGLLDNRSFGGAQVSRTFYARGQTGQQLLLGAYQAMARQITTGNVESHPRTEMLDVILIDGKARGIVTRNLVTGEIRSHVADAVVLATGGYSTMYFLSTNAKGCNVTANWRAHKRGAGFANPCFTQIHPTCIPVHGDTQSKLTLMSESLRNDGRVWVPAKEKESRDPNDIPDAERDYFLERRYPAFGNLVPRDVASRAAKERCDAGYGVGETGYGVYLDFRDSIQRVGEHGIAERYGNLFQMYEKITGENPYRTPMRIYPAPHFTMGGLWVDYNLMTTVPGLHALGEANFSDHGANRLGASALMQGLADGYFVLPYTIGHYFATEPLETVSADHPECKRVETEVRDKIAKLLGIKGKRSVDSFHRELGRLLWDNVGMSREKNGLETTLARIPEIRAEFWENVSVVGTGELLNQCLERAGRVADFLEFAETVTRDALTREESCGGHFREEHQTEDHEARRDDRNFSHAAVWEYQGPDSPPLRHEEPLQFEYVKPTQRSYK